MGCVFAVIAALISGGPVSIAAAESIFVADHSGALVEVDSRSGDQRLVAFGWREPCDFLVAPGGDLWVVDRSLMQKGGIIHIDASTGRQSILTVGGLLDYAPGRGPPWWSMTLDAEGSPIVAGAFPAPTPLVQVDPTTGDQVELDAEFAWVTGLAVEANGDLLVVEAGRLHRLDATAGSASVLSEGSSFGFLSDVAVAANGELFATTVAPEWYNPGSIVRVGPSSGDQSLVSEQGPLGPFVGLDLDSTGQLVVAHRYISLPLDLGSRPGGISRIDPVTGEQTTVAQAGLLRYAEAVAVQDDRTYLVLVDANGSEGILAVDAVTGEQTPVYSGGVIGVPVDVVVDAAGDLLVLYNGYYFCDRYGEPGGGCYSDTGRIIRIDRQSGEQTVLVEDDELIDALGIEFDAAGDPWIIIGSSTGPSIVRVDLQGGDHLTVAEGGLLVSPHDLAFGGGGSLFVADYGAAAILEIDPGTGEQSVVSQGGYLISPRGLHVVPVPEPSCSLMLATALTALGCLGLRRRSPS